ncbi:MAG: hypothetical protein AAFN93_04895 [Bacteroidota bacterium]
MRKVTFLIVMIFAFFGCKEDDEPQISQNSVQFSFNTKDVPNSNGRTASEEPFSIVISIEADNGESIKDEEVFNLTKIGDNYLVDPILLDFGNYHLTKFLILNENSEVILATPIEGSILASLVDRPLPVSFEIAPDEITETTLEVIDTSGVDPEDLGYTSISFNIIPTMDILVSVFEANDDQTHFEFVEASLQVSSTDGVLFTQPLGDSINVVKVRTDLGSLTFTASTIDGRSKTIIVTSDSLEIYRTTPLDFIILSGSAFPKGLFTLISDDIAGLNTTTGEATTTLEITDFASTESQTGMTFHKADNAFYLIQNNTNNPSLVKIGADGVYSEIGQITYNGNQIALAEALAYDDQSKLLYVSVSLNGSRDQGDFWSESLMTIDTETAETTYVTEISTTAQTRFEADIDDMTISNGIIYMTDNAPPSADFTMVHSLEIASINEGGISDLNLILNTPNLVGARIAVTGETIYLTSERSLYKLDSDTPPNINFVGTTHDISDYDGETIVGVTFID